MTARSSGAKKRIVVRRKTQRGSSSTRKYMPPKLPAKPSVTKAKSYGRSKSGGYIIPRFVVSQLWGTKYAAWFIWDMDTANVASGTKAQGYQDKQKAIRLARHYRDTYGAWSVMPF